MTREQQPDLGSRAAGAPADPVLTTAQPGAHAVGAAPSGAAPAEPTLGELVSTMTSEMSTLVRQEIELAKAELKQEAAKAAKGAGMLGAAALAALMTVMLLSFAAAWGLAVVIPRGFAFLVVGLLWAAAAAILGLRGKVVVSSVKPVPPQTVETLKEDVEWAKAQKN